VHYLTKCLDKPPCIGALEGISPYTDPRTANLHRIPDDLKGFEIPGLFTTGYEYRY
jgi:hypothetical protein